MTHHAIDPLEPSGVVNLVGITSLQGVRLTRPNYFKRAWIQHQHIQHNNRRLFDVSEKCHQGQGPWVSIVPLSFQFSEKYRKTKTCSTLMVRKKKERSRMGQWTQFRHMAHAGLNVRSTDTELAIPPGQGKRFQMMVAACICSSRLVAALGLTERRTSFHPNA